MISKIKYLVRNLEHRKLWLWKEQKLRAKLVMLNCALSALGVRSVEARDDVELNRIIDLELRIDELKTKIRMFIELSN